MSWFNRKDKNKGNEETKEESRFDLKIVFIDGTERTIKNVKNYFLNSVRYIIKLNEEELLDKIFINSNQVKYIDVAKKYCTIDIDVAMKAWDWRVDNED